MPSHSTLHCARRCRLLGARVGALSSRCDAAASGAQRAGLLRARRGYLVAWLVSASAARCSGQPPGRMVPAGASAGGSRLTPGGGQVIPRARRPLGVLGAAPPAIARRASLPRRVRDVASSAVATPRVAPGPAHAGSQVAPAYGDAFRAANVGMGPRIRLGTGRAGAVARGAQVAPRLLRDFSAHRSLGSGRSTVPRCFLGGMRLLRRFGGRFRLVGLLRCLSPLLGKFQKFRNGRISHDFRKGALSTQNHK